MSSSINPQNNRDLKQGICTSGPNLVVLARTGDELSHGQAQNGVNFYFEVKFDLEGQGQSLSKTIGILTKVFYIYGPNLVILAERGDELSRGQARDWRTDGHTDRQTQATTIPEGQNWPRVKKLIKNNNLDQEVKKMESHLHANQKCKKNYQIITWKNWIYYSHTIQVYKTDVGTPINPRPPLIHKSQSD